MNNKQKITAVLNAAVTVTVAVFLPLTASADMREDFRAPKGAVRENTGPLFWMHGTETSDRLREYVGRVDESGAVGSDAGHNREARRGEWPREARA